LKGFQPISTVPSLIYQITFKKLYKSPSRNYIYCSITDLSNHLKENKESRSEQIELSFAFFSVKSSFQVWAEL